MTPITITENAAKQIETLLNKAPEGTAGVRLSVKATGCSGNSYVMDYMKPGDDGAGDDIIEAQGVKLYIPKTQSWMLFGTTVDYTVDSLGNSKFIFSNPNEIGRCGCGESFQIERK
ncbi:MAG: iron-sulfur cluster assembly accessory protein [Alphaproteobacteria bacterium]|nr:iron-sulfur cluster assembly accessory protein [Alphaproteobacteria bacterium]MCD8520548.1 iron-sulfur cluster assembly accessory protein [Alphaproteobacteria bacterium]